MQNAHNEMSAYTSGVNKSNTASGYDSSTQKDVYTYYTHPNAMYTWENILQGSKYPNEYCGNASTVVHQVKVLLKDCLVQADKQMVPLVKPTAPLLNKSSDSRKEQTLTLRSVGAPWPHDFSPASLGKFLRDLVSEQIPHRMNGQPLNHLEGNTVI